MPAPDAILADRVTLRLRSVDRLYLNVGPVQRQQPAYQLGCALPGARPLDLLFSGADVVVAVGHAVVLPAELALRIDGAAGAHPELPRAARLAAPEPSSHRHERLPDPESPSRNFDVLTSTEHK